MAILIDYIIAPPNEHNWTVAGVRQKSGGPALNREDREKKTKQEQGLGHKRTEEK